MAQPTGGFQVHPDALSAASASAGTVAARLPAQGDGLGAATDRTTGGLGGWRTAAALRDCDDAWRSLLVRLHDELADQGRKLSDTAERYRAGERCAADAFLRHPRPAPAATPFPLPAQHTPATPPPAFGREAPPRPVLAGR